MERIEFHSRLPRKWIAINVSPHSAVWKVGAYDQPFIRNVCKEHPYLESSLLLVSLCSFFLCLPDRGQLTTLSERHRNQLCCNASSVLMWTEGKVAVKASAGYNMDKCGCFFNGIIYINVTCLQIWCINLTLYISTKRIQLISCSLNTNT